MNIFITLLSHLVVVRSVALSADSSLVFKLSFSFWNTMVVCLKSQHCQSKSEEKQQTCRQPRSRQHVAIRFWHKAKKGILHHLCGACMLVTSLSMLLALLLSRLRCAPPWQFYEVFFLLCLCVCVCACTWGKRTFLFSDPSCMLGKVQQSFSLESSIDNIVVLDG